MVSELTFVISIFSVYETQVMTNNNICIGRNQIGNCFLHAKRSVYKLQSLNEIFLRLDATGAMRLCNSDWREIFTHICHEKHQLALEA
jgi:hypothetical protein